MPQMMPIFWLFIFIIVNIFIHFFFSFFYHNFLIFSSSSEVCKKSVSEIEFLK